MPGFDGTGPLGQGPMTGRCQGFCALTVSEEHPGEVKGFAGLQSVPVSHKVGNLENVEKGVINMPFCDGTGPAGFGPMAGRAVGFYGSGVPAVRPYGIGLYGYGGRSTPWFHRGFGFGCGFWRGGGRGHGRGRFGYW